MKSKIILMMLLAATFSLQGFSQKKKKDKKENKVTEMSVIDTVKLKNRVDSVSYSLGIMFGSNLSQAGFDKLNSEIVVLGIQESMAQKQNLLTMDQANEILNKFVMDLRTKKAKKNLEEGQAFLAKNKLDSSIVTLPSGLQYKVIVAGTGEKPALTDRVTVHYHGMLINGKVFDSSIEKGEPVQLSVNGVIGGWKEALQLMPVGSKWKLFIPSDLAYGENPNNGGIIEANMVLIFDVELLQINKE